MVAGEYVDVKAAPEAPEWHHQEGRVAEGDSVVDEDVNGVKGPSGAFDQLDAFTFVAHVAANVERTPTSLLDLLAYPFDAPRVL